VSGQAEPEGGRGGGMAPPCSPSYPLEEATSQGGAQPGKRRRVRCCSFLCVECFSCRCVCACVCISLLRSSLPPFFSLVSDPPFPLSSFHLINPPSFQPVYGYRLSRDLPCSLPSQRLLTYCDPPPALHTDDTRMLAAATSRLKARPTFAGVTAVASDAKNQAVRNRRQARPNFASHTAVANDAKN